MAKSHLNIQVFQELGLSKNEARIYYALLKQGESTVGQIADLSNVHRRNVYDSLHRLTEKGLVFEIIESKEKHFQAVDPNKLMELIHEQEQNLLHALPDLKDLFSQTPETQDAYIYRGLRGWKNYMRDMLRIGEDAYFIGAKGGWLDERVKNFFPHFIKEAQKKNMRFYHLFDYEVKEQVPEIIAYIGKDYKFLPPGYSAQGAIDLFGDHVNLLSSLQYGNHPEEISFTVIVNKQIAEAFRTWFRFMYDICPNPA